MFDKCIPAGPFLSWETGECSGRRVEQRRRVDEGEYLAISRLGGRLARGGERGMKSPEFRTGSDEIRFVWSCGENEVLVFVSSYEG